MLSEVAGSNKMISLVTSFVGGATPPSLSETSSSNRHMEASSPIKTITRAASELITEMPPPRNPVDTNSATKETNAVNASKLKVNDLNEFFLCFLCAGYKVEATTINECMHSCEYLFKPCQLSHTNRSDLKLYCHQLNINWNQLKSSLHPSST